MQRIFNWIFPHHYYSNCKKRKDDFYIFKSVTLGTSNSYNMVKLKNENKKVKKELEVANRKLEAYEAGNLPQSSVKKIVHDALSHSFLSPVQIDWLLSRKERHRSKKWGNREFEKVCILQIFYIRYAASRVQNVFFNLSKSKEGTWRSNKCGMFFSCRCSQ